MARCIGVVRVAAAQVDEQATGSEFDVFFLESFAEDDDARILPFIGWRGVVDGVVALVEQISILAGAASEDVVAFAADQDVVAALAIKCVLALAAIQ